jgi:hypothetical protein
MNISFKKVAVEHTDVIFDWLAKPHMIEFWDNSQEHKDDIMRFINAEKRSALYYEGIFNYWIGLSDDIPYSFLLTSEMYSNQNDISKLHRKHLSITGKTITIDFGIGNEDFLGKGLAAITLESFIGFYHDNFDQLADTFFIDPDKNNPRAEHVYRKAGFEKVGEFDVVKGEFKGGVSYLMIKKI